MQDGHKVVFDQLDSAKEVRNKPGMRQNWSGLSISTASSLLLTFQALLQLFELTPNITYLIQNFWKQQKHVTREGTFSTTSYMQRVTLTSYIHGLVRPFTQTKESEEGLKLLSFFLL